MPAPARFYLVELRRPQAGWSELEALTARSREAAASVDSEQTPVRFVRSIFVPDTETCFHLFEGSADAVSEASRRAGLDESRAVETVRAEVTVDSEGGGHA